MGSRPRKSEIIELRAAPIGANAKHAVFVAVIVNRGQRFSIQVRIDLVTLEDKFQMVPCSRSGRYSSLRQRACRFVVSRRE